MNVTHLLGRLLNIDNVTSIHDWQVRFAAPWAQKSPAWVFFGCLAMIAVAWTFYYRYQTKHRVRVRGLLAIGRAALLCLLFLIMAEPILRITLTNHPRPWLWLLCDGTNSMALEDELPSVERVRLNSAVGLAGGDAGSTGSTHDNSSQSSSSDKTSPSQGDKPDNKGGDTKNAPVPINRAKPSRTEYLQALLQKADNNLLSQLSEKFRLKVFVFDRPDGVRELKLSEDGKDELSPAVVARQVTNSGEVTALGKAFEDLSLRYSTSHLAGLVVFSDFDQNSGPPPVSAAQKLRIPVHTVGIGAEAAADLAVDLQAPPVMKKAERVNLVATVRQTGLADRTATVRIRGRRITSDDAGDSFIVGEKRVPLSFDDQPVEFSYTPQDTGRFMFTAEVEPIAEELVEQNNRSEKAVEILDDFLRLMYVEYEPTWEWRFIKEVFHRDKLVGMRGFRTFLRSADPSVRRSNELFLSTLTPKRSDFFANDVIFLGDMPASTLSTRFCEMTKEFVGQFGGGLVVISGPRFGPGQLANTPLADMLPVVVEPGSRLRDDRSFPVKLTAEASTVDFMRLGANDQDHAKAWSNLGLLPWYQPVSRPWPKDTTVLAEHPTDTCVDGKTRQPLIAVRKYGRGEVVYLAFDETWRLRRKYGELYYQQFWGQMIHRLGLSHALGSRKRFIVQTDRQQYQPDDKVLISIEAYNANFEPLTDDDLPHRKLEGELVLPGQNPDGSRKTLPVSIPLFRKGVFEMRIPVLDAGEHRLVVKDPITGDKVETHFRVTNVSLERRSAVRNATLQREIATSTSGNSYDLASVSNLLKDFQPTPPQETTTHVFPLWNTWLCFWMVVLLMLGEWFVRKLVTLP